MEMRDEDQLGLSHIEGFTRKTYAEGDIIWKIIPHFYLSEQQQSNWCWISTSLDAFKFYNPGHAGAQCQLAGALLFNNEAECCTSPTPSKCNRPGLPSRALRFLGVHSSSKPVNCLSYPEVRREIDAQRPIILAYTEAGNTVGHAIQILGYGEQDGQGYIFVGDPARGFGHALFSSVLFTYSKTNSEVSFTKRWAMAENR